MAQLLPIFPSSPAPRGPVVTVKEYGHVLSVKY